MEKKTFNGVTVSLIRGDITEQDTDAVVNAANKKLAPGGGVAGAIHRKAGPELYEECKKIGGCETGQSVITGAYQLPSKFVIHTVGPVWHGKKSDRRKLEESYRNSLALADREGLESISFPAISTGAFGYPMEEAAKIAVETVREMTSELKSIKMIQFVLFSNKAYNTFKETLEEI